MAAGRRPVSLKVEPLSVFNVEVWTGSDGNDDLLLSGGNGGVESSFAVSACLNRRWGGQNPED